MEKRLFVAGLPFSFNDQSLRDLFSKFGNVISANVIVDRDTGRSKGFGFVEFETAEEAQAAIAKLNGFDVEGRKIVVNVARPREDRPQRSFSSQRRPASGWSGRGGDRGPRRDNFRGGGYKGGRNRW